MVPESNPVNEEKYLGDKKNNPSIYGTCNNKYIYPLIKFKDEQVIIEKLWKTYLWNCDMKIVDDILQVESKWSRIK